jgi:hypothetical protein
MSFATTGRDVLCCVVLCCGRIIYTRETRSVSGEARKWKLLEMIDHGRKKETCVMVTWARDDG